MFGFSIVKVLFTVLVIVAVWQGFKWVKRRESLVNVRPQEPLDRKSKPASGDVKDMKQCPECGAYVLGGFCNTCN